MRIPGIRRIVRVDRGADGVRRSIDDELAFHFDMTVEQLRAGGLSPDDARAEAERRFGSVESARRRLESIDRERADRERRVDLLDAARQDVGYALRGLRRSPGFTAVVIATFALGIGANAAMFGVIDRLLLRAPSLIANPDGLVRIYFDRPAAGGVATIAQQATVPSLVALHDRAASFSNVAMYDAELRVLGAGTDARQIHALSVTANFPSLLGVHPALGRFFVASEDVPPSGTPVAVLGYEFWQSTFGGDHSVLGRTLVVDNVHYTIIGVAPRGFTGVDLDPVDVVLPMSVASFADDPHWNTAMYMLWARGIARLKPGVNIAAAQAEAARVVRGDPENVGTIDKRSTVKLGPIPRANGPESGETRTRGRVARWLSGVSLALLLVACANIANLLLARAMRRRREIGVRLALGVGRARLTASLLMESLLLAVGGGVTGMLVAWVGGRAMQSALLPDTAPRDRWFDPHVAAVAAVAVLVTGLLTGLAPALHVVARDLTSTLRGGARDGRPHRSRLRVGLMVLQTALSVVLLVGAGLFVRSLRNIRTMDYGYNPAKLMIVDVNTSDGTSRAALAMTAPFWSTRITRVTVPGRDSIPQTASGRPYYNSVSADFFSTMGTRLIAGRAFAAADGQDAPSVAILNKTMARVIWPGESAVGKCLRVGGDTMPCSEVVGVVQDIKQHELRGEVAMQVYMADAQRPAPTHVLLLRVRGDASPERESIRRALAAAEPAASYVNIHTIQERIEPQVRPWTLGASMFTVFGLLALATAAIGLYSVIAYGVMQRTHEFGVRSALGASEKSLIGLVLGEGVRVAAAGLAIGGALALVATRWMESLLFDVSRHDPLVFGLVGATLLGAAVAASLVPAWRASRVDPAAALRAA